MSTYELFQKRDRFDKLPAPSANTENIDAEIKKRNPFIALICDRPKKNANKFIVELNIGPDGEVDEKQPVNVFWLDIEPSYIAARLKKGIQHNRDEVTDYQLTFGWKFTAKKLKKNKVSFRFDYFNFEEMVFKWYPKKRLTRCFYTADNKEYLVQLLNVDADDNISGLVSGGIKTALKSVASSIKARKLTVDMGELAKSNLKKIQLICTPKDDLNTTVTIDIDINRAIAEYKQ